MLQRTLLVAALGVAMILSTGAVAQAGVSSQPPPECIVNPGRFEVTPILGAHHAVQVSTVGITCPQPVTGVGSHVRLMRYWASTKVWTVDRELVYTSSGTGSNTHSAPQDSFAWYCSTAGALMGLQVEDRFYIGTTRVADVTYTQRSTAICPAGGPQPPLGCTDNPRTNGLSAIPGAHNAVQVQVAGDTCPELTTNVDYVTSNVQLLRYWVSSKIWTVERQVLYSGTTGAPAEGVAFYCNTPGALMSMKVVDHFYNNGLRILPWGAPLSFSDITYTGTTTAICPS